MIENQADIAASSDVEQIVGVAAAAIVKTYGSYARGFVARQIEAAEGRMLRRWLAIQNAVLEYGISGENVGE